MNTLKIITKAINVTDSKAFYTEYGDYFRPQGDVDTGYVAACLNTMGNYFAKAKFRVYERNNGELTEVIDHPFLDLLAQPNNFQIGWELKYFIGLYLGVKGNYYLLVLKGLASGKPKELIMLDPMRVRPVSSKTEYISHYEYDMGSKKVQLSPDEVIHIRYPYAGSLVEGKALIEGIRDIIDVDKAQQALTKKFYKEGGFLGLTFTTKDTLTNSAFERAVKQLKEKYAGSENAFKVAVFEQGLEPIKAAYSIKDMELSVQRKLTQEEILSAFRIPKLLLGGTAEGYTKASAEAAEYTYAQTMIDPLLSYIDEVFTKYIKQLYDDNLIVKHDSVAPKDIERKLNYYKEMVGIGALTINEVRYEEDYEELPYELANVNLLNVGGAAIRLDNGEQLGSVPNNKINPDPGSQKSFVENTKEISRHQRELHWKQFDRRYKRMYNEMKAEVQTFFDNQQKRLLDYLGQKSVFDIEEFFNSDLQILINMMENAYLRYIERGAIFSGYDNINNELLKVGAKQFIINSERINQTTKDTLIGKLKDAKPDEVRGIIEQVFEAAKTARAGAIAETTVEGGFNYGLYIGYKLQGYTHKTWVSMKLPTTRDAHWLADGQTVPIDKPFNVGGENLMYPSDPKGSPENTINCLCIIIGNKGE